MYRMKAQGADLDYPISWELAEGDSIASSTWTVVPVGSTAEGDMQVKVGSPLIDGASTACLLTGGVHGRRYRVTNTVTLASGRRDERSMLFRIGHVEVQA